MTRLPIDPDIVEGLTEALKECELKLHANYRYCLIERLDNVLYQTSLDDFKAFAVSADNIRAILEKYKTDKPY